MTTAVRVRRLLRPATLLAVLLVCGALIAPPAEGRSPSRPSDVASTSRRDGDLPVYAYFYQWFTRSSWNRAKIDFPLIGKYSSDDPHVLRRQVAEAEAAGINGFLTSWKSTPPLNRRLQMLLKIAHDTNFDVGVVYEALDFYRRPLPITTVRRDINLLVSRWGSSLRSRYFGKPVIVWTGTNEYSRADIASVHAMLGNRALLLAASKNVADYQKISDLVDGEAYYWSSADPTTSFTKTKLREMAAAVHQHRQLWVAPAAGGFDGRPLGHHRVIPRDNGRTLIASLDDAYASSPDAVGVISWNEWSENTYIEPGNRYGRRELKTLTDYLARLRGHPLPAAPRAHSYPGGSWSGIRGVAALAVICTLATAWLTWRVRRGATRSRQPRQGGSSKHSGTPHSAAPEHVGR